MAYTMQRFTVEHRLDDTHTSEKCTNRTCDFSLKSECCCLWCAFSSSRTYRFTSCTSRAHQLRNEDSMNKWWRHKRKINARRRVIILFCFSLLCVCCSFLQQLKSTVSAFRLCSVSCVIITVMLTASTNNLFDFCSFFSFVRSFDRHSFVMFCRSSVHAATWLSFLLCSGAHSVSSHYSTARIIE